MAALYAQGWRRCHYCWRRSSSRSAHLFQAVTADSRRGSYANASPWSTWQDIEDSMDDWAQEIRMSFDDINERAGKKMAQ